MRSDARTQFGEAEEGHRDQHRPEGKTVQQDRPSGPTFAMSTPATAEPIIWATVKDVEFKATAFRRP